MSYFGGGGAREESSGESERRTRSYTELDDVGDNARDRPSEFRMPSFFKRRAHNINQTFTDFSKSHMPLMSTAYDNTVQSSIFNRLRTRESLVMEDPIMERDAESINIIDQLKTLKIIKEHDSKFELNKEEIDSWSVIEEALLPKLTKKQVMLLNRMPSDIREDNERIIEYFEKNRAPLPDLIPIYPLDNLIPFITLICCSLHSYGSPANRTEWNMAELTQCLGVEASFSVTPTYITITFGLPENKHSISRNIPIGQCLVSCGRLLKIEKLINQLVHGNISLQESKQILHEIIDSPPLFPRYVKMTSETLLSGCAALVFFKGSFVDMGFALILGIVSSLIRFVGSENYNFQKVMEILLTFTISLISIPVAFYVKNTCYSALVLSGAVWNLPGLPMFVAIRELATGNLLAGTSRMFDAFMISLKLGFGIKLSTIILSSFGEKAFSVDECSSELAPWWRVIVLIVATMQFNILLDSEYKNWIWQSIVCFIAYYIWYIGLNYLSLTDELNAMMAAFSVGLVGNACSRILKTPGFAFVLSGILVLVPGNLGVGSATSFFRNDSYAGLYFSFRMVLIGFSLTVGTLFADLVIFPKRIMIRYLF